MLVGSTKVVRRGSQKGIRDVVVTLIASPFLSLLLIISEPSVLASG